VTNNASGGDKVQPGTNATTTPILPLKLFMQQDEPKQPQQPQRPPMWRDDSSVDLSVYTTESKTTVQYPPRDPYGRTESVEWPSPRASAHHAAKATTVVAQKSTLLSGSTTKQEGERNRSISPKTVTGTRLNEWMVINDSRASSPSTAPSTPPRNLDWPDDEEEVEEYYDYDHRIQQRKQNSLASGSISRTSSNPTSRSNKSTSISRAKHSHGPVDLDDSSIEDDSSSEDDDDDNAVVEERENKNFASVFRPKTPIVLPEDSDNEARNPPMVWADHDDDDDGITELAPPPRKLSDEDAAALDRSYNETMKSISFHSINEDKEYNGFGDQDGGYCSDDMGSGAVLLTQEELEKHLNKVQNKGPMPSSYIGGYDQWKQEQEYKRRYFERLQRKVNEKRRHQQLRMHQHVAQPPATRVQSSEDSLEDFTTFTSGQMDKSVASTIATARTQETSVFHEPQPKSAPRHKPKRMWKILPKLTGSSKKKTVEKSEKAQGKHALPPPQVTPKRIEDPSEVANLSLAPLNTVLGMDVGSHGEHKQLVSLHLQEERRKQMQAEQDKEREEWKEQERIRRKKEQYLQKQRELNNIGPSGPRCNSPGPSTTLSGPKDPHNGTAQLCCASFDSQRSNGKAATILSPCILCNDAERTHIAMPCMHFYFCGCCAEKLQMMEKCKCPVCGAGGVNFARVYTG